MNALRLALALPALALSLASRPQAVSPSLSIVLADTAWAIPLSQTLSSTRAPWTVFSFQVGGRSAKYLPGRVSSQRADTRQPVFILSTGGARLADFALITLVQRRGRRELPAPVLRDNPCTPVGLASFLILRQDEASYRIQPLSPLAPGEYMLLDLSQPPVGEAGDYVGFCFTIE